jgi:hypothetical protein
LGEKRRVEQVGRWGGCTQIMYTHVSKCKNDTRRKEKNDKSKKKSKEDQTYINMCALYQLRTLPTRRPSADVAPQP